MGIFELIKEEKQKSNKKTDHSKQSPCKTRDKMKATKAKIEDIKEGDIFNLTEKKDKECVIKGKCISTTGMEVRFKNLDYPEMGEYRITKYSTDKYHNVTIIKQ